MLKSNHAMAATLFDRAPGEPAAGARVATVFHGHAIPPSRLPWYAVNNKSPQDKFYTKREVARHCMRAFRAVAKRHGYDLRAHTFVEPSAGEGGFADHLPPARRIALDIDP